jgi:hypothetical protein
VYEHLNKREDHPRPQRDSNTQSYQMSGRRLRLRPQGHRDRPPFVLTCQISADITRKDYMEYNSTILILWLTLVAIHNSVKTGKTWTLNWQSVVNARAQERSTTKGKVEAACILRARWVTPC